jgi:hypothetical protein
MGFCRRHINRNSIYIKGNIKMMSKWLIALFIIALVFAMNQDNNKKTGKFGFRCGEDEAQVEIYNRITDEFVVYQNCGEGVCQMNGDLPICIEPELKKEDTKASSPLLLIAGIVLLIFYIKRR